MFSAGGLKLSNFCLWEVTLPLITLVNWIFLSRGVEIIEFLSLGSYAPTYNLSFAFLDLDEFLDTDFKDLKLQSVWRQSSILNAAARSQALAFKVFSRGVEITISVFGKLRSHLLPQFWYFVTDTDRIRTRFWTYYIVLTFFQSLSFRYL